MMFRYSSSVGALAFVGVVVVPLIVAAICFFYLPQRFQTHVRIELPLSDDYCFLIDGENCQLGLLNFYEKLFFGVAGDDFDFVFEEISEGDIVVSFADDVVHPQGLETVIRWDSSRGAVDVYVNSSAIEVGRQYGHAVAESINNYVLTSWRNFLDEEISRTDQINDYLRDFLHSYGDDFAMRSEEFLDNFFYFQFLTARATQLLEASVDAFGAIQPAESIRVSLSYAQYYLIVLILLLLSLMVVFVSLVRSRLGMFIFPQARSMFSSVDVQPIAWMDLQYLLVSGEFDALCVIQPSVALPVNRKRLGFMLTGDLSPRFQRLNTELGVGKDVCVFSLSAPSLLLRRNAEVSAALNVTLDDRSEKKTFKEIFILTPGFYSPRSVLNVLKLIKEREANCFVKFLSFS